MAQVLVTESYLDDIADAIRGQNGSNSTYTPAQMAGAVNALYPEPSGTLNITQNGTVDVKSKASANVNVPNTYSASDEGKVVVNQALASQTQKNINTNGTHDTTANNSVVVDVPNSYAAADEGKVVSSGALVAQTSRNISENGTYDTTLNDEVVVAVEGGGGDIGNVYAFLEVTNPDSGTVIVAKGSTALEPMNTVVDTLYKYYYVIPESGEWVVTNRSGLSITITANTYFKKYEASFTRVEGIGFISYESGDFATYSGRSVQRVLNDGILIFAVAKHNSAYIAPAFYTLHDYGVVRNVISGSYIEKVTYSLTNPDDENETITVYGYGAFNGGMPNATIVLTCNDGRTMTIESTNTFFAPYYTNSMNAYSSSPIAEKRKFWNLLQLTADAE